MTTKPTSDAASGWDQATYRCGRCGVKHTVTTEDAYLKTVGVHSDAHTVWDRLNPIERDGLVSILRTILSAPDLAVELLALADRQHLTGGGTQPPPAVPGKNTPQPDSSPSNTTARATE
ncbi:MULTISPECIES: hypothetical protein [Streptomyces violaceusniger group]|uniref:Uncharacterized protein n=2 Tax=Streptomyces rhizosphaericus TaxID=114699 RepID=A0ABN1NZ61_9ACTN|nr:MULTISPECIES: hypothetical protein [Streptomyces violaceusniger group]